MLTKNNARSLAKVSRAKADNSATSLSHESMVLLVGLAQGMLGCLGLWALTWLMYFGFGAI